MAKIRETNYDSDLALLQIKSTLVGLGLPSPDMLLFNGLDMGLMLRIDKTPVTHNHNEEHHNTLQVHQNKAIENNHTLKDLFVMPTGSAVAIQCKDGQIWTHDTIDKQEDTNDISQSYRIHNIKTEFILIKTKTHQKKTNSSRAIPKRTISTSQYIYKQCQ